MGMDTKYDNKPTLAKTSLEEIANRYDTTRLMKNTSFSGFTGNMQDNSSFCKLHCCIH
jgi:hypothetical protein